MATSKKTSTPGRTTELTVAVAPAAVPAVAAPLPAAAKPEVKKAIAKKAVVKKAAVKKPVLKKEPVKAPVAKAIAPAKSGKAAPAPKAKKPKLVRDSFTIPKAEYVVLADLKQRAANLTRPAKKSELLRAAIKTLAALSDAAFLTALTQVPALKTGRPALKK